MEEGSEKNYEKLQKAGLEKRKSVLEAVPSDQTIHAWCADMSDDLAGFVGTIETPDSINIQPGYEENAGYKPDRDGQLQWPIAGTPAGTFYNLAMLPGWQKWMPTYRYATITFIDKVHDLCNVDFKADKSTAQNLPINQAESLIGIPINYMDCNSKAFKVGDAVIVGFEEQKWGRGKVIGFQQNPRACYKMWEELGIANICWYHLWNLDILFPWGAIHYQCMFSHGHYNEPDWGNVTYNIDYKPQTQYEILQYTAEFADVSMWSGIPCYFRWKANAEDQGNIPHQIGFDDPISTKFCKFKIETLITGDTFIQGTLPEDYDAAWIDLYFYIDDEYESKKVLLLAGEFGCTFVLGEHEERLDYITHGGKPVQVRLSDIGITTEKITTVGIGAYFCGTGNLTWDLNYIDFYDEEDMTIPCT